MVGGGAVGEEVGGPAVGVPDLPTRVDRAHREVHEGGGEAQVSIEGHPLGAWCAGAKIPLGPGPSIIPPSVTFTMRQRRQALHRPLYGGCEQEQVVVSYPRRSALCPGRCPPPQAFVKQPSFREDLFKAVR